MHALRLTMLASWLAWAGACSENAPVAPAEDAGAADAGATDAGAADAGADAAGDVGGDAPDAAIAPDASAPLMGSQPIGPANFGFHCGPGSASNCGPIHDSWLTATARPGLARLWDSSTNWAQLNPRPAGDPNGSYNWTALDWWLDQLAAHPPTAGMYTFGHTPCWNTVDSCAINNYPSWNPGSSEAPADLDAGGSATFNDFVEQLTQHCSAAGHCVRDHIKYWEIWNEANSPHYWSGILNSTTAEAATQLYDMASAAVPIIRANVPGAVISTPPVSSGSPGAVAWIAGWLQLENSRGRLSDYFGFHVYLSPANQAPEPRMGLVQTMVNTKNANGWNDVPWMNTETNFDPTTFTCSDTPSDCPGDLARWYILQFAYQGGAGGAFNVGWYNWHGIETGGYDTEFFYLMQWLVGATFTAACTRSGTVWTCPLTEQDGTPALIVWNTAGSSSLSPPAEWTASRDLAGATTPIGSSGQVTIGVVPIMLEAQ